LSDPTLKPSTQIAPKFLAHRNCER
jgi:hypothetical protein